MDEPFQKQFGAVEWDQELGFPWGLFVGLPHYPPWPSGFTSGTG